jgi:peptide/nickel transport system substrate-binding protein
MRWNKLAVLLVLGVVMVATAVSAEEKGPIVDTVYMDVRMNEAVAIADIAAGNSDIFYWGVQGTFIDALDQATLDKLEIYAIPSGSWSFMLNPIPNAAPYQVTVNGVTQFNPFAIKEVRYAFNWLMNRQYIVDEILHGHGGPMFTMATPGQPGTYKYNLIATKLGMTAEGDEGKALADIDTAMKAAAALPENAGRLEKSSAGKWLFDGSPVVMRFLIRVDDPAGRFRSGNYVADQWEKAGFTIERYSYDRAKTSGIAYYNDPANYEWNLYTEGWGAGATRAFWENIICQMYAPWYGYMAGGGDPTYWNYTNPTLDELTQKAYTGNVLTEDEYWDTALQALELGMLDACRVYVAYQQQYYVANKDAFESRFAYGLGDGLNSWSIITANTKSGTLKATQYSAQGSLFMSSWDPVGTDGFNDVYSNNIVGQCTDSMAFESPFSALTTPNRGFWSGVKTEVDRDADGNVIGKIAVPASATIYNQETQTWDAVGSGTAAMSTGHYTFKFSNTHSGRPMGIADLVYASGFAYDWARQDANGFYDDTYASSVLPGQATNKGWVINADGSIDTWFDYNFPPAEGRVAGWGMPGWQVSAAGQNVGVIWEIDEALALMVAEGAASGTAYSFTPTEGVTEPDVIVESCVADIRAKLVDMKAAGHVPAYIKNYITADQAKDYYQKAIDFIDAYGHAYISTGSFYIKKIDTTTNYIELAAFRDPTYPYEVGYWAEYLQGVRLAITSVDAPALVKIGDQLNVTINVNQVTYPADVADLATQGTVSVSLLSAAGEVTQATATLVSPGVFQVTLNTAGVAAGSYNILVIAELAGAVPASSSTSIVLY